MKLRSGLAKLKFYPFKISDGITTSANTMFVTSLHGTQMRLR